MNRAQIKMPTTNVNPSANVPLRNLNIVPQDRTVTASGTVQRRQSPGPANPSTVQVPAVTNPIVSVNSAPTEQQQSSGNRNTNSRRVQRHPPTSASSVNEPQYANTMEEGPVQSAGASARNRNVSIQYCLFLLVGI